MAGDPPNAGLTKLSDLFLQPHRRYNQLTDEWVLVSAGRTSRPWLGAQETQANEDGEIGTCRVVCFSPRDDRPRGRLYNVVNALYVLSGARRSSSSFGGPSLVLATTVGARPFVLRNDKLLTQA